MLCSFIACTKFSSPCFSNKNSTLSLPINLLASETLISFLEFSSDTIIPVTGPVRQDDTVPKKELIIEPTPHATVNGLMWVLCPADLRIA